MPNIWSYCLSYCIKQVGVLQDNMRSHNVHAQLHRGSACLTFGLSFYQFHKNKLACVKTIRECTTFMHSYIEDLLACNLI